MARMIVNVAAISLLFFLTSTVTAQDPAAPPGDGNFDITKYGGKDGSDITQALADAWKAACAFDKPCKVIIPKGTYPLSQANLLGPCKAPITVQIEGTVQAPESNPKLTGTAWFVFERIDFLTVLGGGTFDGQGKTAWGRTNCAKNDYCKNLPINIGFNFVTNTIVQDVTTLNSKQFHVNVLGGKNITFQHFTVTAPEDSPNTDGIHIGRADGVNIIDSNIGTGDDCISIGDGTKNIAITNVKCGPGHGISVGSLGKYPNEEPVEGVTVKGCTLTNTMNGVRIKTWPASPTGTATEMHFEDITMVNVSNPILIDQEYCPWNQCKKEVPSKIKISNVSFKKIKGTAANPEMIKFICSKGVPCEGVEVADVDLKYEGALGPAKFICANVQPKISGTVSAGTCTPPGAAPAGGAAA